MVVTPLCVMLRCTHQDVDVLQGQFRPAPRCDKVFGREDQHAVSFMIPQLRTLVWSPTWNDAPDQYFSHGGRLHATVADYREDLLAALNLHTFRIRLTDGRCLRFESSDDEPGYVPVPDDLRESDWRGA